MAGRFEGKFTGVFEESRKDFEELFLSSRKVQGKDYWVRMLGIGLEEIRKKASELTPERVSVEGLLELIAGVATSAALLDFMVATFRDAEATG